MEAVGVDAARPQPQAPDAVPRQVAHGRGGGREGAVGGGVHGPETAPGRAFAGAHVGAGVSGQIGLVDGEGGDLEPGGGGHGAHTEDERTRQVDQVGPVALDRGGDAAARQGEAHLRIAGQWQ